MTRTRKRRRCRGDRARARRPSRARVRARWLERRRSAQTRRADVRPTRSRASKSGRAAQDGGGDAGEDSRCEYGGRRAGHRSLPRHRGVGVAATVPRRKKARTSHACHGIRIRSALFTDYASIRDDCIRKAMTVEPNRFELAVGAVKTAVGSHTRSHRENAAPQRDGRSATRVRSAMGDNEFDLTMGSTMQLYQGDVGLRPLLQIAGACLAREQSASPGPARSGPSVARGSTRDAPPTAPALPTRT